MRLPSVPEVGAPHAGLASTRGQALVETALLLPVLLVLMLNIMNFSLFIYGWITVNDAARAAAEYQIYNGNAVGSATSVPSYALVQAVVTNDTSSLPGSPIICVEVQSKLNGTVTLASGSPACSAASAAQADPEPAAYTSWSVDVSYTFVPVFSVLSLMSTQTIHQQVAMRSMQ